MNVCLQVETSWPKDRFDQPVFLFENDFALRWFADKYPDVELEEKM